MDLEILKEEFGELTEKEKEKIPDWEMLARRIAEIRKKKEIEEYVRERLREHRRMGENNDSEK